jgi:hypothetical protein
MAGFGSSARWRSEQRPMGNGRRVYFRCASSLPFARTATEVRAATLRPLESLAELRRPASRTVYSSGERQRPIRPAADLADKHAGSQPAWRDRGVRHADRDDHLEPSISGSGGEGAPRRSPGGSCCSLRFEGRLVRRQTGACPGCRVMAANRRYRCPCGRAPPRSSPGTAALYSGEHAAA